MLQPQFGISPSAPFLLSFMNAVMLYKCNAKAAPKGQRWKIWCRQVPAGSCSSLVCSSVLQFTVLSFWGFTWLFAHVQQCLTRIETTLNAAMVLLHLHIYTLVFCILSLYICTAHALCPCCWCSLFVHPLWCSYGPHHVNQRHFYWFLLVLELVCKEKTKTRHGIRSIALWVSCLLKCEADFWDWNFRWKDERLHYLSSSTCLEEIAETTQVSI